MFNRLIHHYNWHQICVELADKLGFHVPKEKLEEIGHMLIEENWDWSHDTDLTADINLQNFNHAWLRIPVHCRKYLDLRNH